LDNEQKQKMIDKVFRWVKINTEIMGINFEDFMLVLKDEINNRFDSP